ncbi:MAG: STAS domain-containing protein [Pirellulaceae bacterium]
MAEPSSIFDIEHIDEILVVTPKANLRELDYQQIEESGRGVLGMLADNSARSVVMDFHRTDYYGSTALAFFLSVWKAVRSRDGQMAFCNLSEHESQILSLMRLDTLWSVCGTREEALATVRNS